MSNLDQIFQTIVTSWVAHEDALKSGDFTAMIDTKQELDQVRLQTLAQLRAA